MTMVVGIQVVGLNLHEIGLPEFLSGFERPIEHGMREQIPHLESDQCLPASRRWSRDLDLETVVRCAFILEKHLALDVERFDQGCHGRTIIQAENDDWPGNASSS